MKMLAMLLLMLVGAASATYGPSVAEPRQVEVRGIKEDAPFDVDAISFASDSAHLSRLHVFAAIPYEQLSFVKEGDNFVASYEFTISIFDSRQALVLEKLYTTDVKATTFEQSVSSAAFSIEQLHFSLPPGVYRIAVACRDRESRVTRRVTKQLTISDYSQPGFQLSDIMLVSKLTEKDRKRVFTPSISPNVGNITPPMHIFFEAYNEVRPESVQFITTIFTDKNQQALKTDTTLELVKGRNQVFLTIDQTSLPIGDYKMYVQAYPMGNTPTGQPLSTTSRSFVVRWSALPKSIKNLDLAIEQLVYIAKEKELDYIKEAQTVDEKQKRFLEFWKKKDPNPNTARNEKMDEYYERVEYANRHFKHYTEGWRTDMGMIYILFGAPSNVDRHPFDSNAKPYEVWSYFDLNYTFVFVDETGFGDYRLTTPIWDVWQRPRN